MLRPYPEAMPAEAWQVVLDAIFGKIENMNFAIHCVEDAVAFALGKAFPDTIRHDAGENIGELVKPMSDEEVRGWVQSKANPAMASAAGDLNWLSIAVFLADLFQKLLAKFRQKMPQTA